jgi:hypothetical protein
MNVPHLNWLERWALRLLHQSPRLGLVIAKPVHNPVISWSVQPGDEVARAMIGTLLDLPDDDDDEPASMLLERLYHAPSYGERE